MKRRPFIDMRSIPKKRVLSRIIPSSLLAAAVAIAFIDPLHFAIAGLGWIGIIASSHLRSHWAPWLFSRALPMGDLMKLLEEKIALLHG